MRHTPFKVCDFIVLRSNLKARYKQRNIKSIENIGFEDFFLVHNLFCHKHKIDNPEKYNFRECLRTLFLDSTYNSGKIQEIHKNFPKKLKVFFESFDSIFTTNYDNNIESFTERKIYYLHGAFHIRSEVYDPESLRNKISDSPISQVEILDEYIHLYSNALTSFSGEMKLFSMKTPGKANCAITKFAKGMAEKPEVAQQIESWKNSENELVRRLYESIVLKNENARLSFNDYYPVKDFSNITGKIDILGLSPNNDSHIFSSIKENDKLQEATYYYCDEDESAEIEKILTDKKVSFVNVMQFWDQMIS